MTAAEPSRRPAPESDHEADPESVARTIALRLLTAAPRSRRQLADALARKQVPEEAATAVLDRLAEVGLVDDAAFAERLVRVRSERGLGRRALVAELRRAGVGDEEAGAALSLLDDATQEATARALLERRWRDGLDPGVQARRLAAMLGRKGYPSGMVARLVSQMVDDRQVRSWASDPDLD